MDPIVQLHHHVGLLHRLIEAVEHRQRDREWAQDLTEGQADLPFTPVIAALSSRPTDGCLASYHTWRRLGYQVREGERAHALVLPRPGLIEDSDEDILTAGRIVFLFDIRQTDGAIAVKHDLYNSVEIPDAGLWLERLKQVAADQGCQVVTVPPMLCGARGQLRHQEQQILLAEGYPVEQQVRTMLHELAHLADVSADRTEAEFISEAATFIIGTNNLGADLLNSSSCYLTSWGATRERMYAHSRRILTATKQLDEWLSPYCPDWD